MRAHAARTRRIMKLLKDDLNIDFLGKRYIAFDNLSALPTIYLYQ